MSEMSERIKRIVEESGMSYSEIEKKTGIPKSALSRYLSGETGKIPLNRLKDLAKALGVSPEYLIGWVREDEDDLSDVMKLRQELRTRPELAGLFKASRNCTAEQIESVTRMIESWAK